MSSNNRKQGGSDEDIKRIGLEKFINFECGRDVTGTLICFNEYGNENSSYGGEVDHIRPLAMDGSKTNLTNLQPLSIKENRHKADNYLSGRDTKGDLHKQIGS